MSVVCLDLEGVLVPEIWITFAEITGVKELTVTTKDVADYDALMRKRLEIVNENGYLLRDLLGVIGEMEPLPGAVEFLDTLREAAQVIILSDTFVEFAVPLMRKLNWPVIFCNSLKVDENGRIAGYHLRQKDGKRRGIEAFRGMGLTTFAAGDSYNDLTMIRAADRGVLFRAPESIRQENRDLVALQEYPELLSEIKAGLAEPR